MVQLFRNEFFFRPNPLWGPTDSIRLIKTWMQIQVLGNEINMEIKRNIENHAIKILALLGVGGKQTNENMCTLLDDVC